MLINDTDSISNIELSRDYNPAFSLLNSKDNSQEAYSLLNQELDTQEIQKKTILDTRHILGDSANSLTDDQILDLVNEIQFLVDSWLEEFERNSFDGKTLNELIAI